MSVLASRGRACKYFCVPLTWIHSSPGREIKRNQTQKENLAGPRRFQTFMWERDDSQQTTDRGGGGKDEGTCKRPVQDEKDTDAHKQSGLSPVEFTMVRVLAGEQEQVEVVSCCGSLMHWRPDG